MLETPLLERMIAELPTIYRVMHQNETSIGAHAVYTKEGTYELTVSTDTSGGKYQVRYPALENEHDSLARRSGETLEIFLDGSFAQTAEWRGRAENWQVVWFSPIGPLLITANTSPCPEELLLSTSTVADLVL